METINQIEIIKGCFFKIKKDKIVEIESFTVENQKTCIWARESYLDSNNEIQNHLSLYYLQELDRIEITKDWIEELGFKLHSGTIYNLNDENGVKFLAYNLKSKKLGICQDKNNKRHVWQKCDYVNMLQFYIGLIRLQKMFLP